MKVFLAVDALQNNAFYAPKPNETSADYGDPNTMYTIYLAPTLDIFEHYTQHDWERDVAVASEIKLDARHRPKKIPHHGTLAEISIQISVYEALLFRDIIHGAIEKEWALQKTDNHAFIFFTSGNQITARIDGNIIRMNKNNTPIGSLQIDMEHMLLEKIHGTLFGTPFVLDPIWLKHQKKCDATKVQIDQSTTEIVHNKHHKDTLWRHGHKGSMMSITKNESLSINNQLLMNIKHIHWKQCQLISLQWFTPWFRLPVHGRYFMKANATS
ncbi:MAG: hypothetical protein ISQ13_04325 [Candidatus Margulisbacteria bacterium]|nr:hypothetical protein [Candidatus Margulisiibacteriota bacterium]